jgi:hypothetical protein
LKNAAGSVTLRLMSTTHAAASPRRRGILVIAALLAVFAGLSWSAVRTKSATYDEPLHAMGAWLALRGHDYRINPEDPPLWHYWAALPNGRDALRADFESPLFRNVPRAQIGRWQFVADTMYHTPGNDPDRLINRSRAMMLCIGLLLGVVIAWWSWRIGGMAAAIVAAALFCLDPNMLAHAPLVKNDVSFSLAMLAVSMAVWHAGRRLTFVSAAAVCLLCGVSLVTKFSGPLVGPIVAAMLLVRAFRPQPWQVMRWSIHSRWAKAAVAGALCVVAASVSWGVVWATYGFRFSPTPDPQVLLNVGPVIRLGQRNRHDAGHLEGSEGVGTEDALAMLPQAVLWAQERRLLPQAWLYGLLYTTETTTIRSSYLLDRVNLHGLWQYFPLAMAFKSPLALIAAAILAAGVGIGSLRRRSAPASPEGRAWTVACLALPPGIYFSVALVANINIGLRHVLPVYPFIFITIGVIAADAWRRRRALAGAMGVILSIGLAAETLLAFPNFIPFFNAAAGGPRGGLYLLGDSNLDWGQDLKLLVDWKRGHPQIDLYLSYFGYADPSYYGIDHHPTLLAYRWGGPPEPVQTGPGRVLAVSANNLQAVYARSPQQGEMLRLIRDGFTPIEVLGGTIYLYDLDTIAAYSLFGAPTPREPPAATTRASP